MSSSGFIPRNVSEVSSEWLSETLLPNIENATKAEVVELEVEKVANGLLSSVFRAKVKATLTNGDTEDHRLFMKIMPPDDEHISLITNSSVDVTEIESYKTLFADLAQFEKEEGKMSGFMELFPHLYTGGYDRSSPDKRAYFMILKDLSPQFEMADFDRGLSSDQLIKSLEALAYYHALAFCFGKKRKIVFKEKYGFLSTFFENFETDKELQEFMDMNMGLVLDDMKGCPKMEKLIPHVENVRKKVATTYAKLTTDDSDKQFLIHGDIWANNVMFNPASDCKVVDWQFSGTGSIFLDIGTMGFISMSPEDTERDEDKLVAAYYEKFSSVCARYGLEGEMPWSREEFSNKAKTLGLFLTFLWCSTSYELVQKYPKLKERVHWVIQKCCERSMHFFQ